MDCKTELEKVKLERDIFRAVLEGAGYENLDDLARRGNLELARRVGVVANERTRELKEKADRAA